MEQMSLIFQLQELDVPRALNNHDLAEDILESTEDSREAIAKMVDADKAINSALTQEIL